jgi:hypothetical protein
MQDPQIDQAGSLRAPGVGISRRPLATFRPDRVCGDPGCETRLSIYNGRQYCWLHEPMRIYHPKVGRRRRSDLVAGY